jgi:hypothetical protein
MRKLLLAGWIIALTMGGLSYPVAAILASGATEAYLISGKDPSAIEVEKELFEAPKGVSKDSKEYREAVLRIYGVPVDEPTKVVFWPPEKFIHPAQLPSLTVLPVYKDKGDNPLQVKTLYFFAGRIAVAAGATGMVLLAAWRLAATRPPSPA